MYEHDPRQLPDSEFAIGSLNLLQPGNVGRMLDPRRTPIRVVDARSDVGMFELEVTAFEDAGAHWVLPLEDVVKFQFALGSAEASVGDVVLFEAAVREFSEPLTMETDQRSARATAVRLEEEANAAEAWLTEHSTFFRNGGKLDTSDPDGPTDLRSDLLRYLDSRGVGDLERALSAIWVSNPRSGEIVKGHEIAMARLGLAKYEGSVVRDPAALDGSWSHERRSDHIAARLGFIRAMFRAAGVDEVVLYRALSFERMPEGKRTATLLSATFSLAVATSWLESDPTRFAVTLMRQPVPVERLFMTYLETDAMNSQFKESEGVLMAQPAGLLF
jgi:hypothetical protein